MKHSSSILDRLPGKDDIDTKGLGERARRSGKTAIDKGREAADRGRRAADRSRRSIEAKVSGSKLSGKGPKRKRDRGGGIAGAATGLALLAGTAAIGFLLSKRRSSGHDDAPGFSHKRPDSDNAVGGRTVTIRRPASELYGFWRDFSKLPEFMENVEEVRPHGDHEAWVIKAPAGRTVELHTRVTEEIENRRIAWESVAHSDIWAKGHVEFSDAPGERGTRVSLRIEYAPPGGAIGKGLAKLFLREPEVQARHDLKRFKMLMETGEIATSAHTNEAATNRATKKEIA